MATKVEAADIKIGMYTSELDRPWIDTDFLFQGFLIDDDEQVDQLQNLCKFIYVDEEKSTPGLFAPAPAVSTSKKTLKSLHLNVQEVQTTQPKQKSGGGFFSTIKQIFGEFRTPANTPSANDSAIQEDNNTELESNHRLNLKSLRNDFSRKHNVTDAYTEYKTSTTIEQEFDTAQKLKQTFEQDIGKILTSEMNQANIGARIELAREFIEDVVDSIIRNPDAMILLTNLKQLDGASYRHALNVSVMLISFGRHLGIPKEELKHIAMGGLLHDIGKSRISDALLNKASPLSKEEFSELRKHVVYGLEIIDAYNNLNPITRTIVAEHHERHDGTGYPHKLSGDSINLYGAMAAIVEAFSAMISPWPYAKAKTSGLAVSILVSLKNKAYHPELVDHFIQVVGVYPIGAIVELSTGEVGIVIRQNKFWRLKPLINVILASNKTKLTKPYTIDLVQASKKECDEPINIVVELPVDTYGISPKDYFL